MAINYDYRMGLKREIVNALRPIFGPNYPDSLIAGKVYVGLEFPTQQVQFPAIFINFTERDIRNVGVGYVAKEFDDEGNPYKYKHFRFEGTLNFTVMALTPIDRDKLAAAMVNIIGLGSEMPEFDDFYQELHDNDYIMLHVLGDRIMPGGDATSPVPWGSADERVFSTTYSVNVFGEFYGEPSTGGLIQISRIDAYPYRNDQPAPW